MTVSKSQINLNMKNLEEVIGKCDFKGTASAFSHTLRELIESYNEMKIDYYEYNQYMHRATKMLADSECSCTKKK